MAEAEQIARQRHRARPARLHAYAALDGKCDHLLCALKLIQHLMCGNTLGTVVKRWEAGSKKSIADAWWQFVAAGDAKSLGLH